MTPDPAPPRKRPGFVWPIVILLLTLFLMGVAAGYLDAMADAGKAAPPAALGAGLVLLGGVAAMALYLRRLGKFWSGWSRRKRLYWASIGGSALLGFVASILLYTGQVDFAADPFFGNGALSPAIAIAIALLWVVGLAVAIPVYQRAIDDHEKQAYLWSGLAGYYGFVIPAPAWWVLARAELLPPANAMLLCLVAVAINAAVYLWLRFR